MDFLNNWLLSCSLNDNDKNNLDILLNNICEINESNITYLLNNKNINNIIEKIIYDISVFHLNKLNVELNESIFIEFWFKKYSKDNSLHIDCDEYQRIFNNKYDYESPFLSCVTYLNDNNTIPTLLTNVDNESYKYKIFENNKLYISLPRKMKQISFNGGKYFHGNNILNDNYDNMRNIFVINLWDKKPTNVPYFNYEHFSYKYEMSLKKKIDYIYYEKEIKLFNINENNNSIKITLNDDILSPIFFENLLYNPDYINLNIFNNYINEFNNYDTFIFDTDLKNKKDNNKIKKRIDTLNIKKFEQRFIIKNHFTKDICKWIINEAEYYANNNSGWTKKRHNNYPTTDLPIELIKNVFNFTLISFQETISKEINNNYFLNNQYNYEITDLFIVKYEYLHQTKLDLHDDDSTITVNILLSNINDFKGGGTYFEDGIITFLNQGDMLIHSGNIKHSGVEITEGKRYVLVFFINLYENI
jgi:hypothetical protein